MRVEITDAAIGAAVDALAGPNADAMLRIQYGNLARSALGAAIPHLRIVPTGVSSAKQCPHCGSTKNVFSLYRDGGSTLYHQDCPVSVAAWPNPDFKRRPHGTRV